MSQDLLAEFGSFSIEDGHRKPAQGDHTCVGKSQANVQPGTIQPEHLADPYGRTENDAWAEDDDDFGDFEGAGQEEVEEILSQEPSVTSKSGGHKPSYPALAGKPAKDSKSQPYRTDKALSKNHPFANNPDILFDADDSDSISEPIDNAADDDFGEFETVAAPIAKKKILSKSAVKPATHAATFDLLGLEDQEHAPSPTIQQATKANQAPPRRATSNTRGNAPQIRDVRQQSRGGTLAQEDDFGAWDDFEDASVQTSVPATPAHSQSSTSHTSVADLTKLPVELIGNLFSPAPSSPPPAPTNIPPPSLLLSLFPPIFSETTTSFLRPLSSVTADQKHSLLISPNVQTFLRNYLVAAHTLAHVIAGRKNRWKRDKYLAQSMRIGPSVSGRSGGMKLAGLDTNESRREDSEVEDVLKVWKEQLGRLKSTVTAVSLDSLEPWPVVPELASVMPIRIAKTAEGGVVSTSACALCGLKREERVAKVDVQVEDSFGEWWIDKTNMHLGCWSFWEHHKERLRGR